MRFALAGIRVRHNLGRTAFGLALTGVSTEAKARRQNAKSDGHARY
jgi:hypothetical protein